MFLFKTKKINKEMQFKNGNEYASLVFHTFSYVSLNFLFSDKDGNVVMQF